MSTFVLGFQTLTSYIFMWEQDKMSFHLLVTWLYIFFIIRHEVHLCGVWQAFKCQLEAFFKEHPTSPLLRGLSVASKTPLHCSDNIFRNIHLILSFLSLYLPHYLHCHFACQYKRGNCSQMISGWYLTLSCVCLVCSATFLTISLPSHFGSVFLVHLALLMSSLCHVAYYCYY